MIKITSPDNKIFKMCLQLENRKHREKLGRYIIEGPNLIEEALKNNRIPDFLILAEEDKQKSEIVALCERYAAIAGKSGNEKVLVFEENLFARITQTENSQGILGIVQKAFYDEKDFFCGKKQGNGNVVVLDRLQDPGNVGTIIRTADAAGYDGIMILKGTVDVFSAKVVRACTGSLFRMPMLFVDSPEQAIDLLKKHHKRVVSTGFETDKYYYETDLRTNIGLVIGNEGNGICEEFKLHADTVIKIPMSGSIESLNASVAAAILMYEAMRH
ncbi:TrmH family RNA methyltransferase [Aminipila terrae]|uniref:RNA methyltransferase n=1 Tax=Aminipila terrae TaxID=2697030 RepID=A0A6P1MPY2_9FIRM|nr:RNA methyltransferase [Aminipila terrae]QHI73055.1 RNA methyltransferase [Aminipila terrae]